MKITKYCLLALMICITFFFSAWWRYQEARSTKPIAIKSTNQPTPRQSTTKLIPQVLISAPTKSTTQEKILAPVEIQKGLIPPPAEYARIDPQITVLIKTMGRRRIVAEQVESIEKLYTRRFRIIIGDDGPKNESDLYHEEGK